MAGVYKTHTMLNLHSTAETFYIEACDQGSDEALVIDRSSTDIALVARTEVPPFAVAAGATVRPICGVMGTVRLLAGMYLVVITKKKKVGELLGHAVFKALEFDVLPYPRALQHLTGEQAQVNRLLLAMIHDVLRTEGFYFAADYDLTHTLQRQADAAPGFWGRSLLERADPRFVWNAHLLREFAARPELHRFACPVVHGFVAARSHRVDAAGEVVFEWAVVSRRSRFRAGVRYYVRGVDARGDAANFVESEQIAWRPDDGSRASFVQTRGSIPLFWSQRPDLKYKPKPVISGAADRLDGLRRHFDAQVKLYGKQVVLNLMDRSGPEKDLEATFRSAVSGLDAAAVEYVSFDFHRECGRTRWHRLQGLVAAAVGSAQYRLGYFLADGEGNVRLRQNGTFRSSCMDCLDRTNVVQSVLARRSLQEQLQRMGVLRAGQRLEDLAELEAAFRAAWADNADACARQYAGTGALKTDFTRTGRRTPWGALADGWTAAQRYCKNNFSDGFRQDAIDLFLGNYAVEGGGGGEPVSDGAPATPPLKAGSHGVRRRLAALPLLALSFSMFNVSLLTPGDTWSETLPRALFWGAAGVLTAGSVLRDGVVDVPKLVRREN